MGVSVRRLAHWQEGSEEVSSLRDYSSKFSEAQIAFVLHFWNAYGTKRKKVRFSAFMKQLRKAWKDKGWLVRCPSRKTVEDMLSGNGARQPKSAIGKTPHTARVKSFFPNAQVSLDGKQVEVLYNGRVHTVTLEISKDLATGADTAVAVGETETYELVKTALAEHRAKHGLPLAALTDNGSANRPLEMELGKHERLLIRAWPRRPQSRGHIEGEFGVFEKNVSHIEIKGRTDEDIVKSIVEVLARLFLRLRNQTPRCRTCPMTPEKLMQYEPSELEREQAYRTLAAEREKRRERQEQAQKLSEQQAALINSVVKEHQLSGDRALLKNSLRRVELAAIREAEQRFYVISQRDTFDPGKRTMAYLCKIALNVQSERDTARRRQIAHRRYGLDQQAERERQKRALQRQWLQDQQQLRKRPHEVILQSFESYCALPESFRSGPSPWQIPLNQALRSIQTRRHSARRHQLMDRVRQLVLAQSEAPLALRYEFITLIDTRMSELDPDTAKSVTPN